MDRPARALPVTLDPDEVIDAAGGRNALTNAKLKEEILSDAHHAYDQREVALGEEVMREVERRVMLSVLDRKWREHLYEMDYLQEGIGLRAMAQRDPLVEYQREGFALWTTMNEAVREESVGLLFHVDVRSTSRPRRRRPSSPCTSRRCWRDGGRPERRPPRRARGCRPPPRTSRRRVARAGFLVGSTVARKVAVSASASAARAPGSCTTPPRARPVASTSVTRAPAAPRWPHRRPAGQHPEERAVPVRLRQEVQDVPRRR